MATLEITTIIGCELACTFCPQSTLTETYKGDKRLSLVNFKTLLNKVPKHVVIHFSGMSEAFLNQETPEMIIYTLEQGYKIALYTTLQGLSVQKLKYLVEKLKKHISQVEIICLHLPDADMNMRGWKDNSIYYEALKDFLTFKDIMPKWTFLAMTMSDNDKIHPKVSEYVQNIDFKFEPISRAGLVHEAPKHSFALGCKSTLFYDHNTLLPNGDVVLCCMDYGLKHILGNLNINEYYELFTLNTLNNLRILNMKPEYSGDSICKQCENICSADKYSKLSFS